jgi:hypothetical protein
MQSSCLCCACIAETCVSVLASLSSPKCYECIIIPSTDYDTAKKEKPWNVEYFNHLGSTVTEEARCTREIKSIKLTLNL